MDREHATELMSTQNIKRQLFLDTQGKSHAAAQSVKTLGCAKHP